MEKLLSSSPLEFTLNQNSNDDQELSFLLDKSLLDDRLIYLWGDIEDGIAEQFIKKIRYIHKKDKEKPIYILINTVGGSIDAANAIMDEMDAVSKDVKLYTIATGACYSAGTIIFLTGTKGCRLARKRASFMFHPSSYGANTDYAEFQQRMAKFNDVTNKELMNYTCERIGFPDTRTKNKFISDMQKSLWLTAKEAADRGIVDRIYEGVIDHANLQ